MSRMIASTYSWLSLVGLVSSKRRWQRPPNSSAARMKFTGLGASVMHASYHPGDERISGRGDAGEQRLELPDHRVHAASAEAWRQDEDDLVAEVAGPLEAQRGPGRVDPAAAADGGHI